jgi:type IV pilus assembly protein PilQ
MYRQRSVSDKMQIGKGLALTCFISTVIAIAVFGSVEPGSMGANPDEGSRQAESLMPVEVAVAVSQAALQPVQPAAGGSAGAAVQSFELKEQFGIRDALAMLASLYKKNIVPSPGVAAMPALAFRSLKDVTFEEAMDAILGDNLKYQQQGNLIKVYTKDEYKKLKEDPERMVYQIFTLYYITAEEAKKLITPVLSGSGKIETSTAAEKQISSGSGGTGGGAGSLTSGGGGDKLAIHETIVLYEYPENIEKVREIINALDVRPKQVLVEATILSATLTQGMDLGVDLNFMGGFSLNGTSGTQDIVSQGSISRGSEATSPIAEIDSVTYGAPIETFGLATAGGKGLRIGIRADDMRAFITALEAVTDVTVLANPKILAVNKQEGSVQIGKTLGYRGSTTIGQGGVATQGEVQFLPTGTVLVFRPYIGNDGYIRMDIYPQDSTAQLNADKVPDKTTAELKTNVLVKDGETIVIGGLFRDVVKTTRSQIPLLGDLPILGVLFRGTSDTSERQEVIVMLTPHIINEPAETEGQARVDDVRRKRVAAKDEMLGIGRAKLAEDSYAKAARYYIEGDNESAMKELSSALWLRPTFLEAIRLKERILAETSPDEAQKLERIVLETVDRQAAPKWRSR